LTRHPLPVFAQYTTCHHKARTLLRVPPSVHSLSTSPCPRKPTNPDLCPRVIKTATAKPRRKFHMQTWGSFKKHGPSCLAAGTVEEEENLSLEKTSGSTLSAFRIPKNLTQHL
jgi:hypothetical protein